MAGDKELTGLNLVIATVTTSNFFKYVCKYVCTACMKILVN